MERWGSAAHGEWRGTAVWLPHLEQAGSVLGTQRHSVPRVARSGGGVFEMRGTVGFRAEKG